MVGSARHSPWAVAVDEVVEGAVDRALSHVTREIPENDLAVTKRTLQALLERAHDAKGVS